MVSRKKPFPFLFVLSSQCSIAPNRADKLRMGMKGPHVVMFSDLGGAQVLKRGAG